MSISPERGRRQRQLGELMTELGLISEEQLASVLEIQQKSQRPLGQIIVELGFASGAAVAHALAMQAGGSLRTEYGFALGVQSGQGDSDSDNRSGMPRLRLAPTGAARQAGVTALPEEPVQPEPVESVEEAFAEAVLEAAAVTPLNLPDEETAKVPKVPEEPAASANSPFAGEPEPAELAQLRSEVEHLQSALTEARSAAADEQERLCADLARLDSLRIETETAHGESLAQLTADYEAATAELARVQTMFAETQAAHERELTALRGTHERAIAEVERLQTALSESRVGGEQELARPREISKKFRVTVDQLTSDEPLSPELALVLPSELHAQAVAALGPPVWQAPS